LDFLQNHIEALIFCSLSPIKKSEINECLTEMFEAEVPDKDISEVLKIISEKYENDSYSFHMIKSGVGISF